MLSRAPVLRSFLYLIAHRSKFTQLCLKFSSYFRATIRLTIVSNSSLVIIASRTNAILKQHKLLKVKLSLIWPNIGRLLHGLRRHGLPCNSLSHENVSLKDKTLRLRCIVSLTSCSVVPTILSIVIVFSLFRLSKS